VRVCRILTGHCSSPWPAGTRSQFATSQAARRLFRYGQTIGVATSAIAPGEHVHVHNLGMGGHGADYAFSTQVHPLPMPAEKRHFMGYHRADGSVGTRNYLGILTSVNCSGSVARFIAEAVEKQGWLSEFENVDGVVPIVHGTGCGMSGNDEGYDTLFRTLQGYARNPNFAGILLLGLGCEVMQVPDLVGRGPDALGRQFPLHDDPAIGRHPQDHRARRRSSSRKWRPWPTRHACARRPRTSDDRHAMRRLRRLFRHHRQPGAGRGVGHAGCPWRHHHPVGNLGDLWCRAPADPPRGDAGGWREDRRAHSLVGGLRRAQWRSRWTTIPRPATRRAASPPSSRNRLARGQGRHRAADPGLQVRRTDHRTRLRVHG
jgi:hypothetical protein